MMCERIDMSVSEKVRVILERSAKEPGMQELLDLAAFSQQTYGLNQVQMDISAPFATVIQSTSVHTS